MTALTGSPAPLNRIDLDGTDGVQRIFGFSAFFGFGNAPDSPAGLKAKTTVVEGINATGSATVSLIFGPDGGLNTGFTGTVGAGAYGNDPSGQFGTLASLTTPQAENPNVVFGAGFSIGKGLAYTTLNDNSDNGGYFHTKELLVGIFDFQYSQGTAADGTPVKTLSVGLGFGAGYAEYDTWSVASSSLPIISPAYGGATTNSVPQTNPK